MFRLHFFCVALLATSALSDFNDSQFDPCSYKADDVLVRDVVVIGGGASGTYGAIALKDMGRSVVVVEREPHFGGHVNTVSSMRRCVASHNIS